MTNDVTFDFSGAAVLVTGGTSGIGHAIATAFADAGAAVTVTGTRGSAGDYETDLRLFSYHRVEMTDPSSIDALLATLDSLDVLVNNAGANLPGGRDEWEPDTFATAVMPARPHHRTHWPGRPRRTAIPGAAPVAVGRPASAGRDRPRPRGAARCPNPR